MIIEAFRRFAEDYSEQTNERFAYNSVTQIITSQLPDVFRSRIENPDKYEIVGSVGQGNWVETPWIALLDKNVTTTTQRGYYACFLMNPAEKFMYLGLAVGWTQFAEDYTTKIARQRIREYSEYLQTQLPNVPEGFKTGAIDLEARGISSRGYEQGQIISKRYDLDNATDNALLKDLGDLLGTYNDLTKLVGNDIQNIGYRKVLDKENIDAVDKTINSFTLHNDAAKALEEARNYINQSPTRVRESIAKKIVRNPKIARFIKESNLYICEICGRRPFKQKNGKLYAEADHIKPLGEKGYDSADNMRCLCAQCHAVVTHGSDDEIRSLLIK